MMTRRNIRHKTIISKTRTICKTFAFEFQPYYSSRPHPNHPNSLFMKNTVTLLFPFSYSPANCFHCFMEYYVIFFFLPSSRMKYYCSFKAEDPTYHLTHAVYRLQMGSTFSCRFHFVGKKEKLSLLSTF